MQSESNPNPCPWYLRPLAWVLADLLWADLKTESGAPGAL